MNSAGQLWRRLWFSPRGPLDLAICRILVCGLFLWSHRVWDFSLWAEVSDAFWAPYPLVYWAHPAIPSEDFIGGVQLVFLVSLATACVGLLTRASLALAFLSSLFPFGLRFSFGHFEPGEENLILMLGIFALAPAGDALSLDRRICAACGASVPPSPGQRLLPLPGPREFM